MQTRPYGDLYKLIQSLAGVKSFAPSEEDDIANFINRRFFTAYSTTNAWPRYLVTGEQRRVSTFKFQLGEASHPMNGLYTKLGVDANGNDLWIELGKSISSQQQSYIFNYRTDVNRWFLNAGSWIKNLETDIYTFTSAVLLLFQRDDNARYSNPWEVVWTEDNNEIPFGTPMQVVPYADITPAVSSSDPITKLNDIGEFIKIHKTKPMVNRSAQEYEFYVDEDGAHVLNLDQSTNNIFVTYKKKFSKFTTSSDYGVSTEEVPEEFFSYIAHGAYADFLTMDGQTSKAIVESERADEHLKLQLEKVDIMNNNQFPNTKFSTYVNRQSR